MELVGIATLIKIGGQMDQVVSSFLGSSLPHSLSKEDFVNANTIYMLRDAMSERSKYHHRSTRVHPRMPFLAMGLPLIS